MKISHSLSTLHPHGEGSSQREGVFVLSLHIYCRSKSFSPLLPLTPVALTFLPTNHHGEVLEVFPLLFHITHWTGSEDVIVVDVATPLTNVVRSLPTPKTITPLQGHNPHWQCPTLTHAEEEIPTTLTPMMVTGFTLSAMLMWLRGVRDFSLSSHHLSLGGRSSWCLPRMRPFPSSPFSSS